MNGDLKHCLDILKSSLDGFLTSEGFMGEIEYKLESDHMMGREVFNILLKDNRQDMRMVCRKAVEMHYAMGNNPHGFIEHLVRDIHSDCLKELKKFGYKFFYDGAPLKNVVEPNMHRGNPVDRFNGLYSAHSAGTKIPNSDYESNIRESARELAIRKEAKEWSERYSEVDLQERLTDNSIEELLYYEDE